MSKWVNRSFFWAIPLHRSEEMSNCSPKMRKWVNHSFFWAIRLHRSEEMSNHERIAQIAHQKWANEWIAHFFERFARSFIFGKKRAIRSENRKTDERIPSPDLSRHFIWVELFCADQSEAKLMYHLCLWNPVKSVWQGNQALTREKLRAAWVILFFPCYSNFNWLISLRDILKGFQWQRHKLGSCAKSLVVVTWTLSSGG